MIRVNHKGTHMDNENDDWNVPGNVSEVVNHVQQARAEGMGVISMKLVGEGTFTGRRRSPAGHAICFQECGRRLRNGRLQEHIRDRRGH
jgi:1-deoxyxylulose-5-phosphate synthase